MATTKCDLFKDFVNCQQLAAMGYLPAGTQSFVPNALNGGFTLPNGCSSGQLGIEYDGVKMVFNSPQVPILAVIAKDVLSKVYYFGSGTLQGRLLNILMLKAEFCYAPPSISPLYVSKTAAYSTGMQPGTTAWNFYKTVALAPPYTNNMASMFRGDQADATWTLTVQKTGMDTVYQGAVSGQVVVSNPQNVPVIVYAINSYVQGGPTATVSCGSPVPFQIPPCSSSACNTVAYWPVAPAAGAYTALADVTYSVGDTGIQGNQVGTTIFQVGQISSAVGMMNTAAGTIASGAAVVQDAMAPQQYTFSGSSQQSYTTTLTCPDTAITTNQATLTAATGQQITQTATVQKLCYELQVRVAQAASAYVGSYTWDVQKKASASILRLKPSATVWDKYVKQQMDLAIATGQDPTAAMNLITGGTNTSAMSSASLPGSMVDSVTYTVTYTRTAPSTTTAGNPAFQAVGDVFVTNMSPLNAQLKEVTVQITNPFGGLPYTTYAACPILTVAAGQTLQCRYVATPTFNPVGAQVTATALYLNTRNGVPSGASTPFTSAAIMVAGGDLGGTSGRKLMAAKQVNDPLKMLGKLLRPQDSGSSGSNDRGSTSVTTPTGSSTASNPLSGIGNFLNAIQKLSTEVDEVDKDAETLAEPPSGTAVAGGSTQTPPPLPNAPVTPAPPPVTTFDLKGLQDECVEIQDAFLKGDEYTTGIITSGNFPTGRICNTTTFIYTVSYGPYLECSEKQAVNQATFFAPDTKTRGEASAPVKVVTAGCGASVTAATKSYAVWAKKSYYWTVDKTAEPTVLSLMQSKAGNVKYKISFKRISTLVNPKLSATVHFDNLAPAEAVTLAGFRYTVTSQCQAGVKQETGTFKCAAQTIPAGGAPLTCQVLVDLPCAASGTFVATATVGNSQVQSMPFTFPAAQATDTLTDSECAIVVDEFETGDGFVSGALADGERPYGKLCGSKDFVYSASFGPYEACGKKKANNIASFQTGNPVTATSDEALVTVDVTGCNLYTPMGNGTSISAASRKRLASRPPEQPVGVANARVAAAAKAVVAAQLNELAGVALPEAVKEAMFTISNVVSATTATPPQLPANLPGLPAAISTLEKLLSGQSGVPVC
eukprot:gene4118-4364_t